MEHRICTDSDFDGLISSFLLKQLHPNAEVIFANPNMLRNGNYEFTKEDIIADLPKPQNFEGTHYDHHPPYTKTCLPTKSCAEAIIKLHPTLKNKYNTQLAKAASRIDTAQFHKEPTPEEIISITLSFRRKHSDNQYRQWLITKMAKGHTLEKISQMDRVQERFEKKREKIKKLIQETNIERASKWGIKFTILRGYNPDSLINELFKKETDYIIKINKDIVQTTANVYKKNPVNLLKIIKKYEGKGNKNRAYFCGEKHINQVMEEIAIEHNEATEYPRRKK